MQKHHAKSSSYFYPFTLILLTSVNSDTTRVKWDIWGKQIFFFFLFWIFGMCIVIKPCYLPWNLLRTTSPPGGELRKRTRPEAVLCTSIKLKTFIQLHVDWSTTALDPLNLSANHFPRLSWGIQKHQALRMRQRPVSAFWYRSKNLSPFTSSQPFIMLPSSISLLTSSLVCRQEDRHRKSLIGTETKQEKFPHPSKELKIFDNVLGLAPIKEGKCQLHSGPANDCPPPSSIMLENDSKIIKFLQVMATVRSRH